MGLHYKQGDKDMDIIKRIHEIGIIPVIAIDDAEKAIPLCNTLCKGGLPAAEITFRTEAGQKAIELVSKNCPDVLVGAGTVLSVDQCKKAIAAGAKFIVSPGYNDEVVKYCVDNNIVVLPGCVNATDATKAVNIGLTNVKFFPAEQSGGINFIKALASVFPKLDFMPTGGVNTQNMMDYLSFDRINACGGTWMVKKDLINNEKWDEIENICKDAVKKMLGLSLAHIGINCKDEAEAEKIAKQYCSLFDFEYKPGISSIFVGQEIECNKKVGRGTNGHIAISTYDVDRAVYHLSRKGVEFDMDSAKYDDRGRLKAIYLKDEFGGFAIHLLKK